MIKSLFRFLITPILAWEASILRSRYSGPLIAITGSVGKTGTKEAIGLVMKKAYGDSVLITPKNLNTEIGVPLTLLGYRSIPRNALEWLWVPIKGLMTALFSPLPKCMVLELGADHPGDIAYLSRLTRPTHAIITAMTEAHTQFLGPLEAIRKEKSSLLHFLAPNGMAVLNGDDAYMTRLSLQPGQQKVLVRLHTRSDYFASGIKINLDGTEAILHHGNRTQRVTMKRLGEQHLYSLLFAAAVADSLDINPSLQQQAFKEVRMLPGRGTLIEGKKGSYILDESYNASPAAMEAGLKLLKQLPATRRVAILGDMRELSDAHVHHKAVGKLAHTIADYVIGVGPLSRDYKAHEWFMTAAEAVPAALRQLGPGVIILVKGSQNTIRLERVVKALMLHPDEAKRLLVRQDKQWEDKT